jgi:hypothetical protein
MSSLTRALLIFSAALMISLGVVSQGEVFYWHEFGVDYALCWWVSLGRPATGLPFGSSSSLAFLSWSAPSLSARSTSGWSFYANGD